MMRCVIVDDEPLAREGLSSYVREIDFLQLTGSCTHPLELLTLLDQQPIDLIFLDIQMPKMSGLDFLKIVAKPPLVILTTAYPNFALEGFQLNVLDYLLKPITFDRFVKAAHKANDYHQLLTGRAGAGAPSTPPDYVFIKCATKYEKIYLQDILYIEGLQNYVTIVTDKGRYVTLLTLKSVAQEVGHLGFIRVHKSYLVAMAKIDAVDGAELVIGSYRVPISRQYRDQVLSEVLTHKLWRN